MTAPCRPPHQDEQDATAGDRGVFLREWLRAPLRVGAIAPSGRRLQDLMTRDLRPEDGPVLELGPGTGAFTRALLRAGFAQDQLALVEYSPAFAARLAADFPQARVLNMDAARLRHAPPFGPGGAGVAICGLPLLSLPPGKVLAILAGTFGALRPGGSLRMFTYGPGQPVPRAMLARLGLRSDRLAGTVRNLPPATVHALTRA